MKRTVATLIVGLAIAAQALPLMTVYVTRYGDHYHNLGCASLRKGAIAMELATAKRRGYTACGTCNPPMLVKP